MIESGLLTLIGADGTIAGIVSTRIWGKQAPQDPDMPYLILTIVDTEGLYDASDEQDLIPLRIQIDGYAESYAGVITLMRAVRALLSGYSGAAGDETIQGAFMRSQKDMDQESTGFHRRMQEYEMFYKEALPD